MSGPSKSGLEIFVNKIPWTLATKQLREYFAQFGYVRKCHLPFDKDTGFHRGYSWITFSSNEGLMNALQKDSHVLEGAKLMVQKQTRTFTGLKSDKGSDHD